MVRLVFARSLVCRYTPAVILSWGTWWTVPHRGPRSSKEEHCAFHTAELKGRALCVHMSSYSFADLLGIRHAPCPVDLMNHVGVFSHLCESQLVGEEQFFAHQKIDNGFGCEEKSYCWVFQCFRNNVVPRNVLIELSQYVLHF